MGVDWFFCDLCGAQTNDTHDVKYYEVENWIDSVIQICEVKDCRETMQQMLQLAEPIMFPVFAVDPCTQERTRVFEDDEQYELRPEFLQAQQALPVVLVNVVSEYLPRKKLFVYVGEFPEEFEATWFGRHEVQTKEHVSKVVNEAARSYGEQRLGVAWRGHDACFKLNAKSSKPTPWISFGSPYDLFDDIKEYEEKHGLQGTPRVVLPAKANAKELRQFCFPDRVSSVFLRAKDWAKIDEIRRNVKYDKDGNVAVPKLSFLQDRLEHAEDELAAQQAKVRSIRKLMKTNFGVSDSEADDAT